jgi:germination protein YpeB
MNKIAIPKREMTAWIIAGVLLTSIVGWAIWQFGINHTPSSQTDLNNLYEKSYYQLVNHTQNIRDGFDKLRVSDDKQQIMLQLVNIKAEADMAEENAGLISRDEGMSSEYIKVINQVSDYSAYLMHEIQMGKIIDNEQRETLEKLYQSVNNINTLMVQGQMDIVAAIDAGAGIEDMRFPEMENAVLDYPVLIYDGPFSETVYNRDPVELTGKNIEWEAGKAIVADFLKVDKTTIEQGTNCEGLFSTWGYHLTSDQNEKYVAVTKKGGKVLTITGYVTNGEVTLDAKACEKKASDFLKTNGFQSMQLTYYQIDENEVTYNFAFNSDGVICYPKLIKVKISLVDGTVTGLDAQNYYTEAQEAISMIPELTLEQAREQVTSRLEITSERLAIIPGNTNNQVLCYEFQGKLNELTYIVYIDATTGKEAKIFKLIQNESGSLVI